MERLRPHRHLRLQRLLDPGDERLLPEQRVTLGCPGAAELGCDALLAPFEDGHVGEGELQLQRLDVAIGVDRLVHVSDGGVDEGARDHEERVAALKDVQVLAADALALAGALGRCGNVDVLHLGGHDALGLGYLREHVDARVGHLDHADVRLSAAGAEARRVGVASGDGVEDGGLAGAGESEDADSQGRVLVWWEMGVTILRDAGVVPGRWCVNRLRRHSGTGGRFAQRLRKGGRRAMSTLGRENRRSEGKRFR